MIQAFKFRIDPCPTVEAKLNWTLEVCRELYNACLQERRDAYRMNGISINYHHQANQLPAVKVVRPDVAGVQSQVLQNVLKRVDEAFAGFFRRVKAGQKAGYPRFRGKNRYDSFTFPQSGWSLEGDQLHLSKIGLSSLPVTYRRLTQSKIKNQKSKTPGWWGLMWDWKPSTPTVRGNELKTRAICANPKPDSNALSATCRARSSFPTGGSVVGRLSHMFERI